MTKNLQPIRGTRDLIGREAYLYEHIISKSSELFRNYGYEPIYTPILEFTDVFFRSLGKYSDVVSKEVYSFIDKNEDVIALRPEFTAAIMRAFISNGLNHQLPLRLYTHGPLFRRERPQKGRQRQFHQVNIEVLGIKSSLIDGEVITLGFDLLKMFGISDKVILHINSLADVDTRKKYVEELTKYLEKFKNDLSDDSQIRLEKNPLRILDSKDQRDQEILHDAPTIDRYYSQEEFRAFEQVLEYLSLQNVPYIINRKLVRGLDYYCSTAFEFITNELGAQGTVLGGGRYDGLSESLGGPKVEAIGFAAGVERLALLIQDSDRNFSPVNVMIVMGDSHSLIQGAIKLAHFLRENGIQVICDYDLNHKKQFKRADKLNAKLAFIYGEEEHNGNFVTIKDLHNGQQIKSSNADLVIEVKKLISQK